MTNAEEKLGDALRGRGAYTDALTQYRSMLANSLTLTKRDVSNAIWNKSLANSYERIAITLEAAGDKPGALENFKSCATIDVPTVLWDLRDLWPADVTGFCRQKVRSLDIHP